MQNVRVKRPSEVHRAGFWQNPDLQGTIQTAEPGQRPLPCCIHHSPQLPQQMKQGPAENSILCYPNLLTHPERQLLLIPVWQKERVTHKLQHDLHAQLVQAASVPRFPKFWLQEFTILHYVLWIWKSRREKMEGVFLLESCLWMLHPAFTESWCLLLQYIYFETQFICCKKLLRPLILEANAERSRMLRILIMLGLGNLMNKRDFS